MTKTAWVFPGQGSQAAGMGLDLLNIPAAKERFAQAERILGWSVPQICGSQEDKLSRTFYTQPCLYVVSTLLAELMLHRGNKPELLAGHSLGEYVALCTAGVFSFEVGLNLVKRRAELMDQAAGGAMTALIGFDRQQLEAQIKHIPDVVLANDNHASQVVISGTPAAIEAVLERVKVKRVIPLNVSGAFHSPLMATAAAEFQQVLEPIVFQPAQIPVLSNVDPTPAIAADSLKQRLMEQMTGPVRWREISLQLASIGIEQVIEVGPGKVLTGLIKRTCPDIGLENVSSVAEISA
ncbi:Malonyl CoA-acyl carrier protein transacylase [uncultured Synechococcales cyanobacterium]|uniref:Malonyl CoA-acyl carrier protein transacylase n=1 Tax=uncultured Synechococcales cyanobacterium TaxID=1936017 RepID=A0A6J4VRP5_9CYAN|nr:Malonyl CoA-acyl carrier protein transacylase [uncultured Synechococcales cyanobacterium]